MISISAGLVALTAVGGVGLATAHGLVFDAVGQPSLSDVTAARHVKAPAPTIPVSPEAQQGITISLTQPDTVAPEAFLPTGVQSVVVGTLAFAPVTSPAPRARGEQGNSVILAQTTLVPRPGVNRATTGAPAPVPAPMGAPMLQPTWLLGVFR